MIVDSIDHSPVHRKSISESHYRLKCSVLILFNNLEDRVVGFSFFLLSEELEKGKSLASIEMLICFLLGDLTSCHMRGDCLY